jgi:hypothetical protein
MLVVDKMRAEGVAPCSFMVGTGSLSRIGSVFDNPVGCDGLKISSSGLPPGVPGIDGESVMGNLNADSGSGVERGDVREDQGIGVLGAVELPDMRPLMLLSGGYEAWKRGEGCGLGPL